LLTKVKAGGVDQTLVEYLLRLKPNKISAENLKVMMEEQKIRVTDVTSDNKTTYHSLLKDVLGYSVAYKIIPHTKSNFMYYTPGDPCGITELPYDQIVEEQLKMKILDDLICKNEVIRGQQYEIELTCLNGVISGRYKRNNS